MLRPLLLAVVLSFSGISAQAYHNAWHVRSENASKAKKTYEPVFKARPGLKHTPIVSNPLPDQSRSITAGSFTLDLNEVFSDTDGNALTFTAASNDDDVAIVSVDGNMLTVTPRSIGNCRIRTTAKGQGNQKADDTFTLTIVSNQPPALAPEVTLEHQILFSGGLPLVLNLASFFLDPDGDLLVYDAESDHEDVALASLEQEVLTIIPNLIGETTITLSVDDQNGGVLLESFTLEVQRGYPATIQVETRVEFDDHRDQGNYRMIALPGNQSMLVANAITGDPQKDWVSFAPDTTGTGQLLPYERSPAFVLKPGKGLWLLSKEDWILSERTVSTVPLNGDGTFEISLHTGWNIISNPLDQDIPWPAISQWNGVSQGIWRWDHGYRQVDTLYSTANVQEAFYFNNIENLETLSLPYFFQQNTFKKPAEIGQSYSTKTILAVVNTEERSASVAMRISDDASIGFDRHDQIAPPTHFSKLALTITPSHSDFQANALAVEARPAQETVHRFDLYLTADNSQTVQFSLEGLDLLADESAILVNLLDTKSYNVKDSEPQTVILNASATPFSLFIGEQNQVVQEVDRLSPEIFSLKQNYPNPFNPITTIEYALPTSQYVELSVYDIMGRHIITLAQGERAAGFHSVQWNGFDQNQHSVANGIYFYRLQTSSWSKSLKMTLIR